MVEIVETFLLRQDAKILTLFGRILKIPCSVLGRSPCCNKGKNGFSEI